MNQGDSQNIFHVSVYINLTSLINRVNVCYYHVTYKFQSENTLYSLPECLGTPCSKESKLYPDIFVLLFHFHQFQYNAHNTFDKSYLNSNLQVSER